MADLSVSVSSSLPEALFDSLDYPWRKRFDTSRLHAAGLTDADDGSTFALIEGDGDEEESAAETDPFVDELIAVYSENKDAQTGPGSAEAALVEMFEEHESDALVKGDDYVGRMRDALAGDPARGEKLTSLFRAARRGVSLEWVDFELSNKPNSNLGNPIALEDLRIRVRAKAELCVRIFGRNVCIRVTTPWFRFEGERIQVELRVEGLQVRAKARVSNIDFVIKVRILGIRFRFGIGVTNLINEQLASHSPVLADFSAVRIAVPGFGLTYTPISVEIPSSNTETTLKLRGAFTG